MLDETMAAKVVRDMARVRNAARDGLGETVARQASRLRSGTKTRKSAVTRERIMAAATELMVERGSTDFQMSEVSERCHMSKGSLYYYFADRSALVHAIFDRSVDELVSEVESVVAKAPSATESIFGLVHILAEGVRPGQPLALAMAHVGPRAGDVLPCVEGYLARIVSILTAQFERAKGEGLVRPEVNSQLGAVAIAGAFLAFEYVREDASTPEGADAVRDIFDLVFSGLGTARARALFSPGAGSAGEKDEGAGAAPLAAPAISDHANPADQTNLGKDA